MHRPTYQQAVEEDVHKDSQAADNQVEEVVQELHVHDHGFVSTREGPSVPDEAHQEDDLITQLKNNGKTRDRTTGEFKGSKTQICSND